MHIGVAETVTIVERPAVTARRQSFSSLIANTLTSGKALAVPINGGNYAVVRNRFAGNGSQVAKRLGASCRTSRSEDGLSLLIWLESKAS